MAVLVSWPAELPAPNERGFRYNGGGNVLRTEMDGGNIDSRQINPNVPREVRVSWDFTPDELAIFESWHLHKLIGGTQPFQMEADFGHGLTAVECLFISDWEVSKYTRRYRTVSAQLQVKHAPVLPEDQLPTTLVVNPVMVWFVCDAFDQLAITIREGS